MVRKARPHIGIQVLKIDASQLRLGMYVCELDRPWIEAPFLFQGFMLNDPDDLMTLRSLCHHVYIDCLKTTINLDKLKRSAPEMAPPAYPVVSDIRTELPQAAQCYGETFSAVRNMLRALEDGRDASVNAMPALVHGCVESIIRNPSAMLWLTRIKHKDQYTAEHCMNVGVLAMALGRKVGLGRKHIELLGLCGMLHDVGKMRLDQSILNKPGRLTAEEFEHVKLHVTYGHEELSRDPELPSEVLKVALSHHERLDGKGYPRGLPAARLDFYTRATAVVDTYDAITSRRCYSDAQSSATALRILYENRGTQFDERLVVQFIDCIGIYPPGVLVELNTGEVGVVLSVDSSNRLSPRVGLVRDAEKRPMQQRVVDLAEQQGVELSQRMRIAQVLVDGSYGVDLESFTRQNIRLGGQA